MKRFPTQLSRHPQSERLLYPHLVPSRTCSFFSDTAFTNVLYLSDQFFLFTAIVVLSGERAPFTGSAYVMHELGLTLNGNDSWTTSSDHLGAEEVYDPARTRKLVEI